MSRIQSRIPVPTRTFTFERKKVVTTTKTTTKSVTLKGNLFSDTVTAEQFQTALRSRIAVSPSGWTLSEILALSYPDDLSRYSVESVRVGWGKGGKVVMYSRSESTQADLLREVENLRQAADIRAGDLRRAIAQNEESKRQLELWQTANLIMHAFGSFAWGHILDADQVELNQYGMYNFVDLLRTHLGGPCAAKNVTLRIFDKLDPSIRNLAFRVNNIKREASNKRHSLAHPVIPDERIRELLREELHDGTPGLHAFEVAAFEHIKSTANMASNIRAAGSGRR